MEVVLVPWPGDEVSRVRLRSQGAPRLLLVDARAAPPEVDDELEDWIRVPAPEIDVKARVDTLERRARDRTPAVPDVDDDGVLRRGDLWVALPPVEARLTTALVERFGTVVSREALGRAGWPDGAPGRNALDVHVLRLRRRLAPVGLVIKTVRSRGYLLEATSPAWAATAAAPAAAASGSR